MIKFLICSTDESVFEDYIVNQFPVVGIAERFVVPAECFDHINLNDPVLMTEELAELGLTFLLLV